MECFAWGRRNKYLRFAQRQHHHAASLLCPLYVSYPCFRKTLNPSIEHSDGVSHPEWAQDSCLVLCLASWTQCGKGNNAAEWGIQRTHQEWHLNESVGSMLEQYLDADFCGQHGFEVTQKYQPQPTGRQRARRCHEVGICLNTHSLRTIRSSIVCCRGLDSLQASTRYSIRFTLS